MSSKMGKNNEYFNALQVKYAYTVTCHKAQGGQWKNVFIDMGYIPEDAFTSMDFYRWLYTAITRARSHVYLINYPLDYIALNDIVMQNDYVMYLDFAESFHEMLDSELIAEECKEWRKECACQSSPGYAHHLCNECNLRM